MRVLANFPVKLFTKHARSCCGLNRSDSYGFTLVEIALALLVISVGMLALFGLFPVGLNANRAALDETRAAMFADEVLNGVRAQASVVPWNIIAGSIILEPPSPHVWRNMGSGMRVQVTQNPNPAHFDTIFYDPDGMRSGPGSGYRDFVMRYRLEIDPLGPSYTAVRLQVRPGIGTTNTYVFYTELYNHGRQ